jgi:hypothetical protein
MVVSHVPAVPISVSVESSNTDASEASSLSSLEDVVVVSSAAAAKTRAVIPMKQLPMKKRKAVSLDLDNNNDVLLPQPKPNSHQVAFKEQQDTTDTAAPFLLAHPDDALYLSPLHTFMRRQIQVFTASIVQLKEPAPGRKQAIQRHQVGLRCLYCQHATTTTTTTSTTTKKRVKRAVCYPSRLDRIYHSVSDMKGDHFSKCPYVPASIKETMQVLMKQQQQDKGSGTATTKLKSSSMAQYYSTMAYRMGLRDSTMAGAVFLEKDWHRMIMQQENEETVFCVHEGSNKRPRVASVRSAAQPMKVKPLLPLHMCMPVGTTSGLATNLEEEEDQVALPSNKHVLLLLAQEQDATKLNALHCWVRRHIQVFAATEQDVLAPSPGRKQRIVVGQVGLRCVHCAASHQRIKRAICYPPSVEAIYHSVSNMKFDHFGQCPSLPPADRIEFAALRDAAWNRAESGVKGSSNSTAKYYREAAFGMGLVDSKNGIRFQSAPKPESHREALPNSMMGMRSRNNSIDSFSALVIAATDLELQAAFQQRRGLSV